MWNTRRCKASLSSRHIDRETTKNGVCPWVRMMRKKKMNKKHLVKQLQCNEIEIQRLRTQMEVLDEDNNRLHYDMCGHTGCIADTYSQLKDANNDLRSTFNALKKAHKRLPYAIGEIRNNSPPDISCDDIVEIRSILPTLLTSHLTLIDDMKAFSECLLHGHSRMNAYGDIVNTPPEVLCRKMMNAGVQVDVGQDMKGAVKTTWSAPNMRGDDPHQRIADGNSPCLGQLKRVASLLIQTHNAIQQSKSLPALRTAALSRDLPSARPQDMNPLPVHAECGALCCEELHAAALPTDVSSARPQNTDPQSRQDPSSVSSCADVPSTSSLGQPTPLGPAPSQVSSSGDVASTSSLDQPTPLVPAPSPVSNSGHVASTSSLDQPTPLVPAPSQVASSGDVASNSTVDQPTPSVQEPNPVPSWEEGPSSSSLDFTFSFLQGQSNSFDQELTSCCELYADNFHKILGEMNQVKRERKELKEQLQFNQALLDEQLIHVEKLRKELSGAKEKKRKMIASKRSCIRK